MGDKNGQSESWRNGLVTEKTLCQEGPLTMTPCFVLQLQFSSLASKPIRGIPVQISDVCTRTAGMWRNTA